MTCTPRTPAVQALQDWYDDILLIDEVLFIWHEKVKYPNIAEWEQIGLITDAIVQSELYSVDKELGFSKSIEQEAWLFGPDFEYSC